jgi:hypothetical protein
MSPTDLPHTSSFGPQSVLGPLRLPIVFQKKKKKVSFFFSFKLQSAFASFHHQLSLATRQPSPAACLLQQHPSIFTIGLRFLFCKLKLPESSTLSLREDVEIYGNILFPYLVDIVIFYIYDVS